MVEEAGMGNMYIQQLIAETVLPIHRMKTDKNKVSRFTPLQIKYEQNPSHLAGDLPPLVVHATINARLVARYGMGQRAEEEWARALKEFETELTSFPVAKIDDQVDAYAHAVNGITTIMPKNMYVSKADREGSLTWRI
jgi:hypothetical protein